jgi:hypothetical protein
VHLATLECQTISKSLAIQNYQITKQGFSNKKGQIASNQDDAWPRHLAMLVMSC